MDDSQILESYLLKGTPQEAAAFFKSHRSDINAGRALAIACRFCGVEYVKALVESGAVFDGNDPLCYYWLAPLELYDKPHEVFLDDDLADYFDNKIERKLGGDNSVETFYVLPAEQRAEIVKYLCENSERLNFKPGDLLFFSMLSNDRIITARLREMGVTFTESRIYALTNYRAIEFNEFIIMLTALGDDVFVNVIREVVKEVDGKRLCYVERNGIVHTSLFDNIENRFFRPGFFEVFLESFSLSKRAREELLKNLIAKNRPECLVQCAKRGWLRQPEKRDEMIAYASEVKSTECLAWLLDYKNRGFDLAAERAKTEKKAAHELNAPHSIAALQKSWHWKKQADGTLIITCYTGTDEVVNIPPKIGKRAVTAIGERALACENMRMVMIPYGIRVIGGLAFLSCRSLEKVIIPDSVVEIGNHAFYSCKRLSEITIPGSVNEIGRSAFSEIWLRRAFVEPGSYAEKYCKQKNIPCEYVEEET